jgi:hypothetical protein
MAKRQSLQRNLLLEVRTRYVATRLATLQLRSPQEAQIRAGAGDGTRRTDGVME